MDCPCFFYKADLSNIQIRDIQTHTGAMINIPRVVTDNGEIPVQIYGTFQSSQVCLLVFASLESSFIVHNKPLIVFPFTYRALSSAFARCCLMEAHLPAHHQLLLLRSISLSPSLICHHSRPFHLLSIRGLLNSGFPCWIPLHLLNEL